MYAYDPDVKMLDKAHVYPSTENPQLTSVVTPATVFKQKAAPTAVTSAEVTFVLHGKPVALAGTWYAYRINLAMDVTTIPTSRMLHTGSKLLNEAMVMGNRSWTYHSNGVANITTSEQKYYPLYRVKTGNGRIAIDLDNSVKALKWIKLIGYSVFGRRQVGYQSAHEVDTDDWVALRIDGANGDVISNNPTANGAFAVLHCGTPANNTQGVIDYHTFDRDGLHTHTFSDCNSTLRQLNLRLQDHNGDAAHFGRIHLWFKVCTLHG
jgi:hypothetical protein